MDDVTSQPKVFANKVIQMVIKHTLPEDFVVEPRDYIAIRVVFRRCGGNWETFGLGEQSQIELLKTIIQSWGAMSARVKSSDVGV